MPSYSVTYAVEAVFAHGPVIARCELIVPGRGQKVEASAIGPNVRGALETREKERIEAVDFRHAKLPAAVLFVGAR
jgi:hypothetical protein